MVTCDGFIGYDAFLSRSYNFQTDIFLRLKCVVKTFGRLVGEAVEMDVSSVPEYSSGESQK